MWNAVQSPEQFGHFSALAHPPNHVTKADELIQVSKKKKELNIDPHRNRN